MNVATGENWNNKEANTENKKEVIIEIKMRKSKVRNHILKRLVIEGEKRGGK